MASLHPPLCDFGWHAPDFDLPDTDGQRHTLASLRGPKGLVIVFICNHCPFVQAIAARLVRDARDLQAKGIGFAAISSNDVVSYPEDGFVEMGDFARHHGFPFPYLFDEDQSVARAYGAVCTPDFFGFNADLALQYRGRLDDTGRGQPKPDARRELFEAMVQVADSGRGPAEQIASIGCSLKWKV